MPQLSLYLNDATMSQLRVNAAAERKTLSRYVSDMLERRSENAYPASFWATYGALDDETFTLPEDIDIELDGPLPSFD